EVELLSSSLVGTPQCRARGKPFGDEVLLNAIRNALAQEMELLVVPSGLPRAAHARVRQGTRGELGGNLGGGSPVEAAFELTVLILSARVNSSRACRSSH